jgi:hypothetical protein
MTELAEYHFTLHHIPGKRNIKADALSRRDDHDKGENDNLDEILLKAEHIRVTHHDEPFEYDLQSSDDDFYEKIRTSSKNRDPSVVQALENHEKGWKELDNGIITFRERLYVPRNAPLREQIIRVNHDSTSAGHPGRYKTAELVTRNYWWPRVQHDI